MKIVYLILLFLNSLFADLVLKDDNFNKISLETFTKQYIENIEISFEEVRNKEFIFYSKFNYPIGKNNIWSYFEIENLKNQEVIFENTKATIDYIEVYILKNNNFYKKIELGDLRDIKKREIQSNKSTFSIILEENAKYQFYINHKSDSSISTKWIIYSKKEFLNSENSESIIWGIFIGIILVLIFTNLFFYFSMKNIAFLSYIFTTLFLGGYQLHENGFLYQYITEVNLLFLNNLGLFCWFLGFFFVIIFQINVLKPKKDSFQFNLLLSVLAITSMMIIFCLFNTFYLDSKFETFKYKNFVSLFIYSGLLVSAYVSYKEKNSLSSYYFLFFILYSLIYFYINSVYTGLFEYFEYFWIIIPVTVLIDIFLLSYFIYNNNKKQIENQNFILSNSRFATLESSMASTIHQWKNPISQIGSQIALLETAYNFDKKNYVKISKETIPNIKESIRFLKNTMNDIYNFYKNPIEKDYFNPKEEIQSLLRILNIEITSNEIFIYQNMEDNIEIFNYKTSFLNVVMIVLENAIFQLKNFKKDEKCININLSKNKNQIILEIEDNGGGIKQKDLSKIFNLNYTTKKESGSGLGLHLAKKLLENQLLGEIKVTNSSLGAKFIIILNI